MVILVITKVLKLIKFIYLVHGTSHLTFSPGIPHFRTVERILLNHPRFAERVRASKSKELNSVTLLK
jgi:hypothetical protein